MKKNRHYEVKGTWQGFCIKLTEIGTEFIVLGMLWKCRQVVFWEVLVHTHHTENPQQKLLQNTAEIAEEQAKNGHLAPAAGRRASILEHDGFGCLFQTPQVPWSCWDKPQTRAFEPAAPPDRSIPLKDACEAAFPRILTEFIQLIH